MVPFIREKTEVEILIFTTDLKLMMNIIEKYDDDR